MDAEDDRPVEPFTDLAAVVTEAREWLPLNLAELDRIAEELRAMPPVATGFDVPSEVLAELRRLPMAKAESVAVPLGVDNELPAWTARARMSDGTTRTLNLRGWPRGFLVEFDAKGRPRLR